MRTMQHALIAVLLALACVVAMAQAAKAAERQSLIETFLDENVQIEQRDRKGHKLDIRTRLNRKIGSAEYRPGRKVWVLKDREGRTRGIVKRR